MSTRMTTRTTRRTTPATTALAALAVCLSFGLAACTGDDGAGSDTATDPDASSSTPSPTDAPSSPSESGEPSESSESEPDPGTAMTIRATGSAGVREATLVHATEVGGSASTLASALDTDRAVSDFTSQFDPRFEGALGAAIGAEQAMGPGTTPYAATVAVGCDAPRAVTIDAGEAGFEVVAKLPKNTVQCLAPMTYVVVFSVPDA